VGRRGRLEEAGGIHGGEVDVDVAGHRGDGLEAEGRRAPGEVEGQGVVDPGICVDEGGTGQLTPFGTPRYHGTTPPFKEDRMKIQITYCGE
jgi:hypothetical protein